MKMIQARDAKTTKPKKWWITNLNKKISDIEEYFIKYDESIHVVLSHNALLKAIIYYAVTQKTQGQKFL